MKRTAGLLVTLVLCLFSVCSVLADTIPASYTARNRNTMDYFGTVSVLSLYDDYSLPGREEQFAGTWREIKALLGEMDTLLSVSDPDSEISRFNRLPGGASMSISPLTAEVFLLACEMHEKTLGYYNPAVLPLVDLWGFSPRFINRDGEPMPYDRPWTDGAFPLPDPIYIEAFLSLTDLSGIVLSGSPEDGYTLTKATPDVVVDGVAYPAMIDLGGIAKGYAVDRVNALLDEQGYEYGYFSCGTSSIGLRKSAGRKLKESDDPHFRLEIRSPRDTGSGTCAAVQIMDRALSSSGDDESCYFIDGRRYCHIIDPFTGYPVNISDDPVQSGLCQVTLISGSAAEDDAYTTALCLMGAQGAMAFIDHQLNGRQAVLVGYGPGDACRIWTNIPDLELMDSAYEPGEWNAP